MPEITLFEFAPTRSARCRWTLLEAGLPFESVPGGGELIGSEALRAVHPMGKLPAALIDGRPLFESTAISTAIADLVPDRELVARPGTWERSLHDQWVAFTLSELEAWLWSSAVNSFVLPQDKRIPAVHEQNAGLFRRGAAVMDAALADADYLVGNRFSVTDIIASYAVNWARMTNLLDGFANLRRYLERVREREHCTLQEQW